MFSSCIKNMNTGPTQAYTQTYTRKSELADLGFSLPTILDKLAAFL
jgi:hypothetical protein